MSSKNESLYPCRLTRTSGRFSRSPHFAKAPREKPPRPREREREGGPAERTARKGEGGREEEERAGGCPERGEERAPRVSLLPPHATTKKKKKREKRSASESSAFQSGKRAVLVARRGSSFQTRPERNRSDKTDTSKCIIKAARHHPICDASHALWMAPDKRTKRDAGHES